MATRTIYIVPARQQNSIPLGTAPSTRQITIGRHVPVTIASSPISLSTATSRPTIVQNATVLHPVSMTRKRPVSVLEESNDMSSIDDLLGLPVGDTHPVRKRERLTHLSAEEKLNRRKLKNRVAAQTARDRKKIRTTKLEEAVHKLITENKALREENKRVNAVCEQLKARNAELERSLKALKEVNESSSSTQSSIGSAESIRGPQQREQAMALPTLVLLLLSYLASASRKSSTTYSKVIQSSNNSARKCLVEMKNRKKIVLPLLSLLALHHKPRKAAARLAWIARHRISI
uniref:X-box-binding protein 1 n=1 Tax=Ascaris suum TaxID=6253 RepID=F1L342_ASCSU